jgi:hypothetical protein
MGLFSRDNSHHLMPGDRVTGAASGQVTARGATRGQRWVQVRRADGRTVRVTNDNIRNLRKQ